MKIKPVLLGALALLSHAVQANEPVTAEILSQAANELVEARSYRDLQQITVEQHRKVKEADRIIELLTEIEPEQLDRDALGRYGDLLAASRGLTMQFVGPVAHAFRSDRAAISTIMGPYGSAKTTTCFQKIINSLIWQPPGPDGIRRARWCVVRDTYGHLQANVMADWFLWFPKTKANYNLSTNTHRLIFDIPLADGKVMKMELEMLFRAVDNQSAEELFKGMALTGLWLNEMDTLHIDVFKYGFPRVGRFRPPGTPRGGWSGVIGDMNAPAEDNWTYDFNVNKNFGLTDAEMAKYQVEFGEDFRIQFHIQPGGMSPGAENLNNLPKGYYERIQIGMSEQEKRRFIHNKFGAVRDGNPVYSQYNDAIHCVPGMAVDPRHKVHLAVDGGNTPSCVFGQKIDRQIRIVDECVVFKPSAKDVLENLGAKEFGQICGEYWNENFAGCELGEVNWADPATWYGDSKKNKEDRAWIYRFVDGFNEKAIGATLKIKPAPFKGNLINPRLDAVRDVLKNPVDNRPGYVISGKCKRLREGFNRGYVTTRVEYSTGGGVWKDEPLKNDFSHVHDANQYLVGGLSKYQGWESAAARDARSQAARNARKGRIDTGNGYFSAGRA